MNAPVSLEICYANAVVTTLVTQNLLGCRLRCSAFGFFLWLFELRIPYLSRVLVDLDPKLQGVVLQRVSIIYDFQIATSMTWFLFAMIVYTEKQRKCQELERVIGRSRMPTLADQNERHQGRSTPRALVSERLSQPRFQNIILVARALLTYLRSVNRYVHDLSIEYISVVNVQVVMVVNE